MKKVMLIGRTGAGKTSFCQAVHGEDLHDQKTQAIEVINSVIDTPGEFLENRALYRALIVTSAEADLIILVQDCTDDQCMFAPGFASMFGKPVIGLVSKIDLSPCEQAVRDAESKLELAGCTRLFHISSKDKTGVAGVKAYLGSA